MTATDHEYEIAKTVVEMNARAQARYDASTFPLERVADYLVDPMLRMDAHNILTEWAKGPHTAAVFVNVPTDIRLALSEYQRQELINYWIILFPNMVADLLRARLDKADKERESNASK